MPRKKLRVPKPGGSGIAYLGFRSRLPEKGEEKMSSISDHHRILTNGVGKCSVPMWMDGMPAGFCDEPAYGKPVKCVMYRDNRGRLKRIDGRYDGYVPALACPAHGGPRFKDKEQAQQ